MAKELASAAISFLTGVFGLIIHTKSEDKGIKYIIIRNVLWGLCVGSCLIGVGFYIHSHCSDFLIFYVIITLSLLVLIFLIMSCFWFYKYYPFSNTKSLNVSASDGVIAFNSNKDYNDTINPLEENANEIITLTKRINIAFKPEALIKEIANQRFGQAAFEQTEKNNYSIYVDAHKRRKHAFFSYLASGKEYYEIYCGSELIKYIETFYHNGTDNLDRKYLTDQITNWLDTIRKYPNYHVIICGKEGVSIPLKYKIYDRKYVVMHDSVGKHPQNRVNSFMITAPETVSKFVTDFETIWNLSESQNQSKDSICQWIQTNLIDQFMGERKTNA